MRILVQGEDCVTELCVTCTQCAPGFFKSAASTERCEPCPANTFLESPGGQGLQECVKCPAWASASGTNHTSPFACKCAESYYLVTLGLDEPSNGVGFKCDRCPTGLTCRNDGTVVLVVENSTWVKNVKGVWLLETCPMGYFKFPVNGEWDQQRCEPCAAGTECVQPGCDTCSPCKTGTYKDAPGTLACRACPQNTYNPDEGATAFAQCRSCPDGAVTVGNGQTSSDACKCNERTYLASGSTVTCANCPSGAVCASGFCALRTPTRNCSAGSDPIPGTWVRSTSGDDDGKFRLVGCPAGFQTQNASHDTQKCHQCLETQYIVNGDKDQCQKCPPGLTCRGDHVVVPVVENSTWAVENGIYILATCPMGYSKISVASEWDQQRCEPCAAGTECVWELCDTCSPCKTGTYKDAPGTLACRACPQNTYNPDTGATAFAQCRSCPPGAETGGRERNTNLDNCTCQIRTYLTVSAGVTACKPCPRGGECQDRNLGCGLRTRPRACPVVGEWQRDIVLDEFILVGCPTGYKLENGSGHDNRECRKCAEGFYVQDSRNPSDLCRKCPSSAT